MQKRLDDAYGAIDDYIANGGDLKIAFQMRTEALEKYKRDYYYVMKEYMLSWRTADLPKVIQLFNEVGMCFQRWNIVADARTDQPTQTYKVSLNEYQKEKFQESGLIYFFILDQ